MSADLVAALEQARVYAFRGSDATGEPVSFDDPVERAAMLLHRFSFETVDEAVSMVTSPSGQERLAYTWAKLSEAERQLMRKRAAALGETLLAGGELRAVAAEAG